MNELTYLPVTDRNGNYRELGLLASGQWLPMYSDRNSTVVNRNLLAKLNDIDSIKVSVETGTATFRKENSKYWYAYKKLKGKLNKIYVGSSDSFTELSIATAVEMANTPKTVTQNLVCVTANKPLIEKAGKGKSDRHLQPSLITENEALEMAQFEIKELKTQNEFLVERIVNVTELYQETWQKASKLEDEFKKLNVAIAELMHDSIAWQESRQLSEKLIETQKAEILSLKLSNADLERRLDYEENLSLDNSCMAQSLADSSSDLIDEVAAKQLTIDALEKALEEKEYDKNCCLTIYEQVSDRNQQLTIKLSAIQTIIDKHRARAFGKTKQGHPRFNKLLEFLDDIDKDCL